MKLHEIIAKRLKPENAARLDCIPECVIEDVLRLGFAYAARRIACMNVPPDVLDLDDWQPCEGCDNILHPDDESMVTDAEGCALCQACAEETRARNAAGSP